MSRHTMPDSEYSQNEALKPIALELGITVYLCQQFETSLLFLTAILGAQQGKINSNSFKDGFCSYSEKTLGHLVKTFGSKIQMLEGYEAYIVFIRKGVEMRNSIVHGFILRNTERLLTNKGRSEVVDELRDAQHVINERLQSVNELLDRALKVFGGSLEQLQSAAEFQFEPVYTDDATHH